MEIDRNFQTQKLFSKGRGGSPSQPKEPLTAYVLNVSTSLGSHYMERRWCWWLVVVLHRSLLTSGFVGMRILLRCALWNRILLRSLLFLR